MNNVPFTLSQVRPIRDAMTVSDLPDWAMECR